MGVGETVRKEGRGIRKQMEQEEEVEVRGGDNVLWVQVLPRDSDLSLPLRSRGLGRNFQERGLSLARGHLVWVHLSIHRAKEHEQS